MKLNNGEIWMSREPLAKLMEQKFPIRTSYDLAMMVSKLNAQLKVIDEVRNSLVRTHGTPDKDNPQQMSCPVVIEKMDTKGNVVKDKDGKPIMKSNPNFSKFMDEFAELLNKEEEIDFGKTKVPVKLPEKVAATCDKCSHNMDRPLEIEPSILMALEKFIEV